jgi:hypothetical protein
VLVEEKANKYAAIEALRRKVRGLEERNRKAKQEISRLNSELGIDQSTTKARNKSFQTRSD